MRAATGRFAVVFALVSVSVSGWAGVASAAIPGDQLWAKTYNGPANGYDAPGAVAMSPDGSALFVVGSSDGGTTTSSDYVTVAIETATGTRLWARRYNPPINSGEGATSVAVSPDGSRVYVTGSSVPPGGFGDYLTVAFEASTGVRLWARRFGGGDAVDDYASSLGVSPDGSTVFVTGGSIDFFGTGEYEWTTVAYGADGTKLWSRSYTGPGFGDDNARDLAVSPDGSLVYVTGYSRGGTSSFDYATIAYDASTGARVWGRRYNGPKNSLDAATAVAVSSDGTTLFVTGGSYGVTSDLDYATVAYDASTGARLWVRRYNGPGNIQDNPSSVVVSSDGAHVFVTGLSLGITSANDYATLGYDASTGATLWVKRYNGPGNGDDNAVSIAVSPDGTKVFVTGASPGETSGLDYATIAYDAPTGLKLWASRDNGEGNADDEARAVVVGSAGTTAFVTGYSVGLTSGADFKTIAYAA